jgi:hypothetical protein
MSELNIYEKLLKITEELKKVKKNLTVGSGSYGYKAVGEMDILNAVKPLEIQYGVYSYPMDRKVITSEILTAKDKTKFFMRVETTYRFVNVEKPSEFVDQVSYGDGVDSLDKAPGKAMTYSDKYSLMKAYKIMTGDDPDQNHSKDTVITGKKPREDVSKMYERIIALKLSSEKTVEWEKYFNVTSLFDLDSEQMEFMLSKFDKRLGKK